MTMNIQVYPDTRALSMAAAQLFVSLADEAIRSRGRFAVALSGGNTPRGAYELLSELAFREQIQWEKVHVFFGDERCVPSDDPRSNLRMAREALLDRVPLPPSQIHPIFCDTSPIESAARYEAILHDFFPEGSPRFDLVLLGMGEDGHTASLFPGTTILDESASWTAPVCPPSQELCRVTLTAPVINLAMAVVFLVSGDGKAATLRDVLEGPRDPHRLPAQIIHPPDGQLLWLVDRAAARLLSQA